MSETNLLIIMDDEHSRKILGCYGNPRVKTPHLDRLAGRGTLFENAYTNCPTCVPARASLATGRYVHQTGYWDNAIAYDGRIRSWAHRLQETGHRVVSIGKLHYRSGQDPTGFDRQIIPMHIADGRGDTHGLVREPAPPVRHQSKGLAAEIGPGETPHTRYDRNITAEACRWLQHEAPRVGKPWVLFVSFLSPHFPLVAPPEFYAMYDPNAMPLPKQRTAADAAADHPWWQAFENCYVFDRHFASDRERRIAIASYHGLCSFTDANVGRVLEALSASGFESSTRIAFMSDHGDNLGARRLWGKSTMYEESAGVPLIVAGPDVPRGKRCRTAVSLVDFFPTVLDAVGERPGDEDAGLAGASLLEIANRADDPGRPVFSEYHAAGSRSGAFMLRKGRFKYIHYAGYAPELYDLEADPEELHDLSARASSRGVLSRFESELRAMLEPEAIDRRAKQDQQAMIEKFGGTEAILAKGGFHGTPPPA